MSCSGTPPSTLAPFRLPANSLLLLSHSVCPSIPFAACPCRPSHSVQLPPATADSSPRGAPWNSTSSQPAESRAPWVTCSPLVPPGLVLACWPPRESPTTPSPRRNASRPALLNQGQWAATNTQRTSPEMPVVSPCDPLIDPLVIGSRWETDSRARPGR